MTGPARQTSPVPPADPGELSATGLRGVGKLSRTRRYTIITASSALAGALLNATMLALSARSGQTGEIAAYTVMGSALAGVAVLLAGGTSLLYAAGDDHERLAVRCQRIVIALPVMLMAAGCLTAVYGQRGYDVVALAAAAVMAIGNNLFELLTADLTRQFRFVAGAVVTVTGRGLALALLLTNVPLTVALAVGVLTQLVAAEVLACRGASGRTPIWRGISVRAALTAFRLNRNLMVLSLGDAFTGRGGGVLLSMAASPHTVGTYGAVYAVYQAMAVVLYGGLQVPMAVRVRRRHGLAVGGSTSWESEVMVVAAAAVTAACGLVLAGPICTELLRLPEAATGWLQLLLVALPFMTVTRAVILNRLGDGDYPGATRLTLLPAALLGTTLLVQLPHLGPAGTAGATTVAEVSTAAVIAVVALSRRRRAQTRPASATAQQPARTATTGMAQVRQVSAAGSEN